MKISIARLETLVWALIYGGLFAGAVGGALERSGHGYGRALIVAGGLAVVAGIVLVWVRSRLPEA